MIIQHNISSINAYNNLNINKRKLDKNLERLSSGYRINRAGDDAAGLAISESMRSLINGTAQAERNVKDGIGLIQTAEGAMQEIHSMLQRARQLSIAASNGTYDGSNRENMQVELEQLMDEVDRIAKHTDYNGISVLQGPSGGSASGGIPGHIEFPPATKLPGWVTDGGSFASGELDKTHTTQENYKGTSYSIAHAAAVLDFSALNAGNIGLLRDTGFHTTCFTCDNYYSIEFTDGPSSMITSGDSFIFKISLAGITTGEELTRAIVAGTQGGAPNGHYTRFASDGGKLIIYDDRSSGSSPVPDDPDGWGGWDNPDFDVNYREYPLGAMFGNGIATFVPDPGAVPVPGYDIVFQIGPTSGEKFEIDLPNITSEQLNIKEIRINSQKRAFIANEKLEKAITFISQERGRMGAYQQRLEHACNSLAVTQENLTSAESRIRDSDMADEVTAYTKNNILLQAAQSMLAQANATPQNILNLLQ
ncbi:flagellin N-terminal helical domain-containing protein [Hungatella hathewayi]|uniref:flagellin N-terminal helical domain-containing protein n=1 Tax=Hungatella hathewayi TaxID=154046 RepID=UPI003562F92C